MLKSYRRTKLSMRSRVIGSPSLAGRVMDARTTYGLSGHSGQGARPGSHTLNPPASSGSELPKDVYLKTVSDARRLIDCLLTSAVWRLGWDRSYLLLSIPDADIGHAHRMPHCIVRSPPQIITHLHRSARLHLDLVSIGTNGIPRTNLTAHGLLGAVAGTTSRPQITPQPWRYWLKVAGKSPLMPCTA